MPFRGFSKEALRFLSQLSNNNTREWFNANRAVYEGEILEPAKDFVVAMGPEIDKISKRVKVEPRVNGSIRRIARDTRFSPNAAPYKDHLDFFFIYEGAPKEGPGYFLRVMAKSVAIGAGTHRFEKQALTRYRSAVAHERHGKALGDIATKLRRAGYDLGGEHYKRVPRGFEADHERADLLKYAGIYAHKDIGLPKELTGPSFTKVCARHFARLAPLSEWIDGHINRK